MAKILINRSQLHQAKFNFKCGKCEDKIYEKEIYAECGFGYSVCYRCLKIKEEFGEE